MSDFLLPHRLQHTRPSCQSLTPGLNSNSIESVMPSNYLILCHPLLLLPSIFPSIRVFSNESALRIRWSNYFSFNISPSNEHSGLISFRMNWLELLEVQGTLKSLLQHHWTPTVQFFSINSSAPSLVYSPTLTSIHYHWKTTALTRQTIFSKVMSLLFNMLSRLVITFLPRSKRLFISWLQSPSTVIWEPPPNKFCHCFHCFPIYFPWSDGTRCHDLVFWMLSFKPTFSLSSFTLIKRLFSSSSLSYYVICIFEVIDISPGILISACAPSSLAFHMMYSA